ncbi:MAG: NAD(P)-dependent oxidoreductase [Thermoleophilaceae bacterium]
MKVFVAGATGAIGRPLVRQLVAAGHEVTGMTRSAEKARALEQAGARAAVCDAFDREGVIAAVGDARPDVVVHQLTDLPSSLDLRRLGEAYAGNDRVRREATPHLLEAARAGGARRVVAQSIGFLYAPEGGAVKVESDPTYDDAPPPLDKSIRTVLEVERAVVGADGLEGVVLRYGFFYGPGTYYAADGDIGGQVRARRYPVVGSGAGISSFIHTEDAAAATVAALDRGAPGIYNVVDDEPAPIRQWLPVYAQALGAKPPRRVPRFVARLAAGPFAVMMSTQLRGASNARARRELGWTPRYPSWREGFAAELGG